MHLGRRIREGIAVDLPDEVTPDEQIPTLPDQQPLEVETPEPAVEPEKTPDVAPEPEKVPEPQVEPEPEENPGPVEEPTPEEPVKEPEVEPAVEPEHDDDPLFPDYVPEQWPDNPIRELPVPEPEKVN